MLRLLLPILLGAISPGDEGWKPTDAELQRAHEMLAGTWRFLSINDKGENLGPRLVETRFARDGILTVAGRQMTIVNPVTGEERAATYRIDPTKTPRRIDLITRDDRMLRGVYKFEDDNLVLCLQPAETKSIPTEFSVPDGSDLMLLRLKAMGPHSALNLNSVPSTDSKPASRSISDRSLEPVRDQGPSEGELRRAHDLLAGTWDILSITDDGELLGPDLVRAKFAENGRIQVGTRNVALVAPKSGERRLSAIRIDPSKAPSEIDLTTQFDEVLKGIYRFNGDELVVCLAKRDGDDRPTAFDAPTGSNDMLFRLKMAVTAAATTPQPAPVAARRPAPKPVDTEREKDEQIRQRLVGAWSLNDFQGNLTLVFRTDGTFSATRTWRSGLKRLFEGDTTVSEGRWSYSHGLLDALVTSTMDPKLLSRNYQYWIQSVGDTTLVAKNLTGELRTARRLR
jgi:uncharacterized protein (TIGR03067 family)